MKLVKTKDGSFTVFNESLNEHYHSLSGALEEAFEKHVKPLQIKSGMKLLDFCFGIGYNSIAALYGNKDIEITALEIDLKIVELMPGMKVPPGIKNIYKTFSALALKNIIRDHNNNSIELILGDASETIKDLTSNYFDRIFFDPFSPQKQPRLWSLEVFRELYRILKKPGQLSTYSCAGWIRRNLKQAGFTVQDGPIIGRRSPATIAHKN